LPEKENKQKERGRPLVVNEKTELQTGSLQIQYKEKI
jgi:hypothetical protein